MNRQMQDFVDYVRSEMLGKMQQDMGASEGALVALRRPVVVPAAASRRR
jgi:MerR family transcriptional regulator/heat shock protein HspR